MSRFLKGNYKVQSKPGQVKESQPKEETTEQEFERRATEKLGGSIAFVQKRGSFVWSGDDTPKQNKS